MKFLLAAVSLLAATVAMAAPRQITAVYEATRNGQPFAYVTETYTREGDRYTLESVTEGIGVYALFGKRRLASSGDVTPEGLRPSHFEQHQGDQPKKDVFAEFDWTAGSLEMKYKGKASSVALQPGTQDLASYAYQFMFMKPAGEEVSLPVTTGRKLRVYHYRIVDASEAVETPAGNFKTVHLQEGEPDDEQKELWLGAEAHHLPVRIRMRDEKGVVIEQTLTRLNVE